jgi:ABC-type Zn uptake system ZnuABC Zn-binding protein ZnuA
MMTKLKPLLLIFTLLSLLLSACQPQAAPSDKIKVIVVENFLADIVQNVAGDRVYITPLIPINVDPHSFEPAPRDVVQIAQSRALIINGGGIETWLKPVLDKSGGNLVVIEASKGLTSRTQPETDPHFWMDPNNVISYVATIRDGLTQVDPAGKNVYTQNANQYIARLKELDVWTAGQVQQIPPEKRLLVTNHESLGYFADRYGFKVIGTIIPSVSTDSSPSAQEVAQLINLIRSTGVKAIFLETGANPDLAQQIGSETGVKVITDLHTESLTDSSGPAPTYIDMIKSDVNSIVGALK